VTFFFEIEKNSIIHAFLNYLNEVQCPEGSWFNNPFITAMITRIFDACNIPVKNKSVNEYLINCIRQECSHVLDDEIEARSEIIITLAQKRLLDAQTLNQFVSLINKTDLNNPLFTMSILSRALLSLCVINSLCAYSENLIQEAMNKIREELKRRLHKLEGKGLSRNVNEILVSQIVLHMFEVSSDNDRNKENLSRLINDVLSRNCSAETLYFLSYLYKTDQNAFEEKIITIFNKLASNLEEKITSFLISRIPERELLTIIITMCNFSYNKGVFVPLSNKSKFDDLLELEERLREEKDFILDNLEPIFTFLKVVKLGSKINISIENIIAASALTLLEKAIGRKLKELGLEEKGSFDDKWKRLKENVRSKENRSIDSILTKPLYDARSKVVHSGENVPLHELKTIVEHLDYFIKELFFKNNNV